MSSTERKGDKAAESAELASVSFDSAECLKSVTSNTGVYRMLEYSGKVM